MDARVVQSFYPQRSSRAFGNSNNAASEVQAERPQTIGQVAQDKQDFDWESLVGSRKILDSQVDFLKKVIPKIEEEAEKSGIEGLVQMKLIQVNSLEPKQLLHSNENQFQHESNMLKLTDFWTPSRSTFSNDFVRWKPIDNDESQMSENQFFGRKRDEKAEGAPMLTFGPFQQSKQLVPLLSTWDGNDNLPWSNSPYPGFFDLIQQVGRQQSIYRKQSPFLGLGKYDNDKIIEMGNIQWQMPVPVMQQNPLPTWGIGEGQDGNVPMGDSWLNSVQDEADSQWAETNWQGQQQQQQQQQYFRNSYPYPRTWQASMNQGYYQNIDDWDVQKANVPDDSDGKITNPVFPSDNVNDINNNVNDFWSQFLVNMKGRLQQLKVQKTIAEQPNVRAVPVMEQTEGESSELQQQQQQVHPEIKPLPEEEFKQSSSVSIIFDRPDGSASRTFTSFVSNNDHWQTNSSPSLRSEMDNQEQSDSLNQEREELPMQSIPDDLSTGRVNLQFSKDDPNKDAVVQQSDFIKKDIGGESSSPILFQVDEPILHSADIDENLLK